MLWLVFILGLAGLVYYAYNAGRGSERELSRRSQPRIFDPASPDARRAVSEQSTSPDPAPVSARAPVDLRAKRLERTVDALETRVHELEVRLRELESQR